jgi:RNA polymerase sigma-70 factor, ECF subfamily
MAEMTEAMSGDEFARLTNPFRGELLAHCYRLLGSVHDAEDLVQETYLRAWRSYDGFEGRSSIRTWLYKIATRACLTALERRGRRPLPAGLARPSSEPEQPLAPAEPGVPWLEPLPDALLAASPGDPATIVAERGSIRLAFVAALQHLPARQRAALILRDVLAWRAVEVAELLGTTTAGVNSALQRARAQLAELAPAEDGLAEPDGPQRRALVDRYVAALEQGDVEAMARLLRHDVEAEMPPLPTWFIGREPFVRFLARQCFKSSEPLRGVAMAANGQPAVGMYALGADGRYHPYALHVLTLSGDRIGRIVAFLDPGLFALWDSPAMSFAPAAGLTQYDKDKSRVDAAAGVAGGVPTGP